MSVQAAIDVGTSSVKLLVLELPEAGGAYRILAEDSRITGLGKGVAQSGVLAEAAMRATLDCMAELSARAKALGAQQIRVAGTEALRLAGNRDAFAAQVRAELGLELEVLSGEEEARLSRDVALRELPSAAGDVVFFDVGGGSTELTWCRDGALVAAASLKLGARRSSEDAGLSLPVAAVMRSKLESAALALLQAQAPQPGADRVQLAGLGGTASQAVWLLQGQRGEARMSPHGAVVRLTELEQLYDRLAPLELAQVQQWPLMDPARAELMAGGLLIIASLLRFYRAEQFMLIDRGLRYGLLLAR